MDERSALLAEILAHPESDLPRLVYADFIEQYDGEIERAEFIRLQCQIAELQAHCSCGACVRLRGGDQHTNGPCAVDRFRVEMPDGSFRRTDLIRRETGLLTAYAMDWFEPTNSGPDFLVSRQRPEPIGFSAAVRVSRGFIAEVRGPMEWLMGVECDLCLDDAGPGRTYTRSPGGVLCTGAICPCKGTGRTPGHLLEIVNSQPVQFVGVTDEGILWERSPAEWVLAGRHPFDTINDDIWNMFSDPDVWPYPTKADSERALSDALLKWARTQVEK
jgi:uncharacterized protein (TIGR02996 family)